MIKWEKRTLIGFDGEPFYDCQKEYASKGKPIFQVENLYDIRLINGAEKLKMEDYIPLSLIEMAGLKDVEDKEPIGYYSRYILHPQDMGLSISEAAFYEKDWKPYRYEELYENRGLLKFCETKKEGYQIGYYSWDDYIQYFADQFGVRFPYDSLKPKGYYIDDHYNYVALYDLSFTDVHKMFIEAKKQETEEEKQAIVDAFKKGLWSPSSEE